MVLTVIERIHKTNMLSLHNITHAVMIALIATLVRKYLQLRFEYEDLELTVQSYGSSVPETQDTGIQDLSSELEKCKNIMSQNHKSNSVSYHVNGNGNSDSPSAMDVTPSKDSSGTRDTNIDYLNGKEMSYNDLSTSVWCYGNNRSERICHFHNLCYFSRHKDFVFIHGKDSVMENLPDDPEAILDLSSVDGHNNFFFSFSSVLAKPFKNLTVQWINETSLIMSRFKPDNLMHVLHDDILPLHQTVKWITFITQQSFSDIQFVFMDNWEDSEFDPLYDTLSDHKAIRKMDLDNSGQVVCFSNSFVGLLKTTTWYQYGFFNPQGPKNEIKVTSEHVHDLVHHLLMHLPSTVNYYENTGQYLVLLSRKLNRLILNEAELIVKIAQETKIKVVSISSETHTIEDMMHIVHGSQGIIGMHGSLMSLCLFLRPGSVVVELFPYAVNPSNYTPYSSLAGTKGMNIIYKAWTNTDKDNTVMHPEYVPELGGIYHLTDDQQDDIKSQTNVPAHLCCSDPSWLFHIYQDTTVDVKEVTQIITAALEEGEKRVNNMTSSSLHMAVLFPGLVNNITCERIINEGKIFLKLSWVKPWNIPYIKYYKLNYEVWLQNSAEDDVVSFMLSNQTSHVLSSAIKSDHKYHVWVRCVLNGQFIGVFRNALDC